MNIEDRVTKTMNELDNLTDDRPHLSQEEKDSIDNEMAASLDIFQEAIKEMEDKREIESAAFMERHPKLLFDHSGSSWNGGRVTYQLFNETNEYNINIRNSIQEITIAYNQMLIDLKVNEKQFSTVFVEFLFNSMEGYTWNLVIDTEFLNGDELDAFIERVEDESMEPIADYGEFDNEDED